MAYLHQLRERYRHAHHAERFYQELTLGSVILVVSLVVNMAANVYASHAAPNVVSDLFLNVLPLIQLDYIYVEGALALILVTLCLGLYRPQRLPFLLKTVGLFILIRSFFLTLTHLSLPLPGMTAATYTPFGELTRFLSSGNDLFFSGHTGYPFLLALIFWKERVLRYIFLAASIVFGATVLLGHVHYSIDVFAAFFITYTIYDLAVWLFTKDHAFFHLFPTEKQTR